MKNNTVSKLENELISIQSGPDIPLLNIGSILFERYLVLKQVNSERVYLVSDTHNADYIYALKITDREKIFSDQFNLRREYINHAEFSSPHIVKLFDAFEDNNYFGFLMEFVGGGDLLGFRENTKFSTYELVFKLLKGMSCALVEIHSKSFLHGDIKPENILVGSNGVIKLTDFGISRNLRFETTNDVETRGTLKYLCPQYLTTGQLKSASDIFSLGLVAYELVYGKIPFENVDIMTTLKNRVYEESPFLKDVVPECPILLAKIIQKCLKINPDERYQSCDEILKDLDRYQSSENLLKPKNKIRLFDELSQMSRKKKNRTTTIHGTEAA